MLFTTAEATRLDKSNPELERTGAFNRVKYAPVIFQYKIEADATGAPTAFVAPFPMEISDITVLAQATVGGGTVTPQKGADAMCTAIACATDGAMTRMSAGAVVANKARLILAAGDLVKVDAANAGDRGIVTFLGYRI